MAAGARRDRDQPVGALFDRLARITIVDEVVEREAAPIVHGMVEILTRAQRGDDARHLPFRTSRETAHKTVVGSVDAMVDRERRQSGRASRRERGCQYG